MKINNYNKFITENKKSISSEVDVIYKIISENCKEFLDDLKRNDIKSYIFRGTKERHIDKIIRKTIRKDRESKTMDPFTVKDIDNLFFDKFGERPRTESAFVTGDYVDGETYGDVYLFFPIGKYKILWSEYVRDMWIPVREMPSRSFETYDEYKEDIRKMVDSYKDTDLKSAIYSGNEIMFICDEYLLVKEEYGQPLRKLLFS